MKGLFDTNILIDYLNGVDDARNEISLYEQIYISPITWMEVMVGVSANEEKSVRKFLERFVLVEIDFEVAEKSVTLRKTHKIKLPDAIIWASANKIGALLVSRNSKDFPETDPCIRVPYSI